MSHFRSKFGCFLHVNPIVADPSRPSPRLANETPVPVGPCSEPSRLDDLTLLGLSGETVGDDRGTELDRLSLTKDHGETHWNGNDAWLSVF